MQQNGDLRRFEGKSRMRSTVVNRMRRPVDSIYIIAPRYHSLVVYGIGATQLL